MITLPENCANVSLETLDVLGLGLTVDMLRQSDVLQAMVQRGGRSIIKAAHMGGAVDATARALASTQREADTLEHALGYFVGDWAIPNIFITAKRRYQPQRVAAQMAYDYVGDLRHTAGLHAQQTQHIDRIFDDFPEGVLESAFQFFEQHPAVPALLLFAQDGMIGGADACQDGDLTEGIVALLLARRDRVDALRPYARASTGPLALAPVQPPGLPPFQPSQFVPEAWLDWQIKQFDALPSIGRLHRPVTVSYLHNAHDKRGKSAQNATAMSAPERHRAFQSTWQMALQNLPTGQKPAHIFFDHGDAAQCQALVPLTLALQRADPDFDLFDPLRGYNLHRRLGDLGAASPFVSWSLGLIASYHHNAPSLTVNLRALDQATITLITPGNDPRPHPAGDPLDFGLAPVFAEYVADVALSVQINGHSI
jgi:hypothetical protein